LLGESCAQAEEAGGEIFFEVTQEHGSIIVLNARWRKVVLFCYK
jgi:hypothetical protein